MFSSWLLNQYDDPPPGTVTPAEYWAQLGRALGFATFQPCAWDRIGASFAELERAKGAPAFQPIDTTHWLYGARKGHAVILTCHVESRRTRYIVQIDPPLFMGLAIGSGEIFPQLFAGEATLPIGHTAFDAQLRLAAFDREQVRALLWPGDPRRALFLEMLLRYPELYVTDSTVALTIPAFPHFTDAVLAMDHCVWIADELAMRCAALPATLAQRAEWKAFADEAGLQFDPRRMSIFGERQGTCVEIALDTSNVRLQTLVNVHWPHALDVAMSVRMAHHVGAFERVFQQDIQTGDDEFDEAFLVQGHPVPKVLEVLQNPILRSTLRTVAGHAYELTMHPGGIFWRCTGAPARKGLEAHVTMAVRATEAIFGALRPSQPFR